MGGGGGPGRVTQVQELAHVRAERDAAVVQELVRVRAERDTAVEGHAKLRKELDSVLPQIAELQKLVVRIEQASRTMLGALEERVRKQELLVERIERTSRTMLEALEERVRKQERRDAQLQSVGVDIVALTRDLRVLKEDLDTECRVSRERASAVNQELSDLHREFEAANQDACEMGRAIVDLQDTFRPHLRPRVPDYFSPVPVSIQQMASQGRC